MSSVFGYRHYQCWWRRSRWRYSALRSTTYPRRPSHEKMERTSKARSRRFSRSRCWWTVGLLATNVHVERANLPLSGRFHWVASCLGILKRFKGSNEIRKTLASLPSNIFKIYESILLTIPKAYVVRAKNALQRLAFLERPLFIEKLAEAVIPDNS